MISTETVDKVNAVTALSIGNLDRDDHKANWVAGRLLCFIYNVHVMIDPTTTGIDGAQTNVFWSFWSIVE